MIPVFLDSACKHKNLACTYKNWLPDVAALVVAMIVKNWLFLRKNWMKATTTPSPLHVMRAIPSAEST
jgi:hypothetical protein